MGVVDPGELRALDHFREKWEQRRQPVVFDVGANVGEYSVAVLARFPGAHLYAFEPQPDAFARLASSLQGAPNAVALNHGLSYSTGLVPLRSSRNSNCVHASIEPGVAEDSDSRQGLALDQEQLVLVRRLDNVAAELKVEGIDWLKIDVEGHELAVLDGAQPILDQIGVIQFEFNCCARAAGVALRDLWEASGKRPLFRVEPHGGIWLSEGPDEVPPPDSKFDYLAVQPAVCGYFL